MSFCCHDEEATFRPTAPRGFTISLQVCILIAHENASSKLSCKLNRSTHGVVSFSFKSIRFQYIIYIYILLGLSPGVMWFVNSHQADCMHGILGSLRASNII